MKKIGISLFIFFVLNIYSSFAQNYLLEYDALLSLTDAGNHRNCFTIWSANYTTFNGKTGSMSEFIFRRLEDKPNYQVKGSRLIPASDGFIKEIVFNVLREVRGCLGLCWNDACKGNAVVFRTTSSTTTCFNLGSQTVGWACLTAKINKFQCYPDLSLDSNPAVMTSDEKLVVQATAGFPSQVYKWKYSTTVPYNWQNVPASCFVNGKFEASSVDLFGKAGALDMNGKNFYLCIDLGCNKISNIKVIEVKQSAPGIQSLVTENVKCLGESNGAMTITLDREIISGETVEVSAYQSGNSGIEGNIVDFDIIDSRTLRVNNLSAGAYTVLIDSRYKKSDGSSTSFAQKLTGKKENIVIAEPSPVVFSLNQKHSITCNGGNDGSFKVETGGGTPGYKLWWRLQGTAGYSETENMEVGNLPAGVYEFYVTDANGCELSDDEGFPVLKEVELGEPEVVTLTETEHNEPSGNGMSNASITVQIKGGTPAYTTVWKNKDTGATLTDVNNAVQNGIFESTLRNIPAGDYTVTATDAGGCSQSMDITMDEPFAIKGNIVQTKYIACYGDANASLKVTNVEGGVPGGFSFGWYKLTSATDSVYLSDQTSITGLGPGRYVVTIKDTSDPPNVHNLYCNVSEPGPVSASLTSVNISCYNGNNGSITVKMSGGTKPYSVYYRQGANAYSSVSFSVAQYTLNNLSEGTYELYVKDKNDCPALINGNASETVTITQPENEFVFVSQQVKNPSGAGRSDGKITVKADGGLPFATDPKYRVIWKNASGGIVSSDDSMDADGYFTTAVSGLPKGIYTVQISGQTHSGASGPCTLDSRFEMDEPKPLSVIWTATPILCHGNTDGKITVQASGGIPGEDISKLPYLYEWSRLTDGKAVPVQGANADSLINITAGQYSIKVTDYSDPPNIKEFDYTLTEPDELKVTVSSTPVSCYEGDNGTVKVNVTGGTPPYSLFYKNDTAADYTGLTALNGKFNITGLISGKYAFYVKDSNDCPVLINNNPVDTVTVTQPASALAVASQIIRPPSGKDRADGYIILTVSGGTPFTSDPAYSVVWTNEDGNPIDAGNSNEDGVFITSVTDLPKGTYSVGIKDSLYYGKQGNCYLSLSMTLDEPGPVMVELENTKTVDCFGEQTGELVAHVSGGLPFLSGLPYKYKWYRIEGETEDDEGVEFLIENRNDSILSGVGAGLYMLRVEDSCEPANTSIEIPFFEITEPPQLITGLKMHDISCFGGRNGWIDISVEGGVGGYVMYAMKENTDKDYCLIAWDEDKKRFFMDSLNAGNYRVYIQDANLCYAKIEGNETATIALKQPVSPLKIDSALAVNPSSFGASNGSIKIHISGGTPYPDGSYTAVWKDGSGKVIAEEQTQGNGSRISTAKNLPEGAYYVEVRDLNYYETDDVVSNEACIAAGNYTLTQPEPFTGEVKEIYISCHGQSDGELTALVQGGIVNPGKGGLPYKFQWHQQNDRGEYVPLQGKNESKLTNLSGGDFRVVITDYSWLPNVLTFDYHLVEPEVLKASAADVDILCGQTASVSAAVSGGTPPYTYQWSTGAETDGLSGLYPGAYMVFVTDSHGCTATATAHVTSPGDVRVTGEAFDPVCYQGSDGKVVISVSGGTAPYTYRWSNDSAGRDMLGVKAGVYTVNVIDRDGCACSESFTLKDPAPVKLDLGGDQVLCIGQVYEPNPVYDDPASTFKWTGDNGFYSTEKHPVLDRAGTYRLTITDSKGCRAIGEMRITTKDYDISCEIAVNSSTARNDTLVIVNISYPEADRIEWLFSPDDPILILQTTPELAMVVFTQEGEYNVGMRSYVADCFMDMVKSVLITPAGSRPAENTGLTDIKKFITYPNPNRGVFTVDVELNQEANIRLRLISLVQGIILNTKTASGSDKYSVEYNETLPSGAYILLLETPTSQRSLKLIIY